MEATYYFLYVCSSLPLKRWSNSALTLNGHPANFMFVIVTKIYPLDSINEALNYLMTISHEIPVVLKKIQK